MQIGIVGLPQSGKTTLFQTITRTHLDPSALTRAEAHHAIVKVPDPRLDDLASVFMPKRTVYATVEFVDVVGLKTGETGSTQFTTNFLANVKTNDALVQVVRLFADDTVPHPDGTIDPVRDIAAFETEFILSDLAIIEGRLERVAKQIQKAGDAQLKKELPVLEKIRGILDGGKPLRSAEFSKEEWLILRTYQLLSVKPLLIALNAGESQREDASKLLRATGASKNTKAMAFFGKIELEMADLPEADAEAFMREYGITESALAALIREAYALLGLQSFFTVGEDECRAWTIRTGMTAQEAAGAIHSDFVSKFIRAEVVPYDQFIADGKSMAQAKDAGHWRLEGKEYVVRDGDIMEIRHS